MLKKPTKILFLVLENIPTILTIVLGAFVVLKNQEKAYEESKLLEWTITILCLMATSMFIERFTRLRNIENNVEETNVFLKNKEGKASIDEIFVNRKRLQPLEERWKHAKDIQVTGASLFRLTTEYIGLLEEKAKEGCRFKFILLNPECEATKLVATYIVYEVNNIEIYKNNINIAITNLKKFQSKFPDRVEIKIANFIPAYGMVLTDTNKENGAIGVELYPYIVPTRDRPHIVFMKQREPIWYSFFLQQFEAMWDNKDTISI